MNRNGVFLVVIFVFLAACSMANVKSDYQLSGASKTGVVIGSLTMPKKAIDAAIYYRDISTGKDGSIDLNPWWNPLYGGDFDDALGKLFVLELSEGEYEINSWKALAGSTTFRQGLPAPMKFRVVAGAVCYLGDVTIDISYGKNIFGISIPGAADMTIQDKRQRDIQLAETKYPNLDLGDVKIELLEKLTQPSDVHRSVQVYVPVTTNSGATVPLIINSP